MSVVPLKRFKPAPPAATDFWYAIGIEDGNTARSEAVHRGFKPEVYRNLLDKAQLSQNEFHNVAHIPVSTIKRRLAKGERFSVQESDTMYRLAMLIKLATDLFHDEQKALEWVRENVYGLGGKRPLDMISTTVDFEEVRDLIGRIEHGVFS